MFPKILFPVIWKKKNFILVYFTFFYKKMFQKNTKMALKWPKMTFSKKAPVWFVIRTGAVFNPNFRFVDQMMCPESVWTNRQTSKNMTKPMEVPTFSAQTGRWLDQWWVDQWERWFNRQTESGHTLKYIEVPTFSAKTGGLLDQWWVDQWEQWFNYQHFLNKKGHKKISITFFI